MTHPTVPPMPDETRLTPRQWHRAWERAFRRRAEDLEWLRESGYIPARHHDTAQIVDRFPWGAVMWETHEVGATLSVGDVYVTHPDTRVRHAYRAAAADVDSRVMMIANKRLGRNGIPQTCLTTAGGGLLVGIVAASYMAEPIPGGTVEMLTMAGSTLAGGALPLGVTAAARRRTRRLDYATYGHALQVAVAIGGYVDEAPSLSATVTPRLRAILWEASEVTPQAVGADLGELAAEHHIPVPLPPAEDPAGRLVDEPHTAEPPSGGTWMPYDPPSTGNRLPEEPPTHRTRTSTWENARARHERVKDAYAKVITDPLNALEHSALFDVANHRTERFLLALGECDDQIAVTDEDTPHDRAVVDAYAASVRRLALLWDDAHEYAERVGGGWLPDEEASAVRKAGALMRTASSDSATLSERGVAAGKAKEALKTVKSFRLPNEAMQALSNDP